MSDRPVHLANDDSLATITLDSQYNRDSLSESLVAEFNESLDAAEAAAPRAIVVGHAGPAFGAGADLKERSAQGIPDSAPMIRIVQPLMDSDCPDGADVQEGTRSFAEQRPPVWAQASSR